MRSEVRCANCRKTEWTDSGKVVFIPREGADFGGRWIHGADCGDDEVPVDELLQLQKQADWERALTEYRQLREEIGRLEETGDCSCDANEFHTCSLCAKTATLDQRARSLMNLWGDTWAMRLTAAITDTPGVKSSSQGPAREETPPISTNCICKGFLQDPNCSAHYEIVTQTTADAGAKSVVAAPQLEKDACVRCGSQLSESAYEVWAEGRVCCKCVDEELAGAAALPSEWISPHKSLPDEDDVVLVAVVCESDDHDGGTQRWEEVHEATMYRAGGNIVAACYADNAEYMDDDILGWRELPSPPVPSKEPK